jgi:hypothetical protein
LGLQSKYVVEDAIDAPSLEAMVGDHTRPLEVPAKLDPKRPVDARLSSDLRLLQQLKAPIECELPGSMTPNRHLRPFRAPLRDRRS